MAKARDGKLHETDCGKRIRRTQHCMRALAMKPRTFHSRQVKWDGSGYPERLSGDAIPLSARLMAVADVCDALISRRVYKPPFSHAQSLEIMRQGRGAHVDPDVLDAFLEIEAEFARIADAFRDADAPGEVDGSQS